MCVCHVCVCVCASSLACGGVNLISEALAAGLYVKSNSTGRAQAFSLLDQPRHLAFLRHERDPYAAARSQILAPTGFRCPLASRLVSGAHASPPRMEVRARLAWLCYLTDRSGASQINRRRISAGHVRVPRKLPVAPAILRPIRAGLHHHLRGRDAGPHGRKFAPAIRTRALPARRLELL